MTRKDYALLADAIRDVRVWDEDELEANVSARVTYAIADALAVDNPRFARDRFLIAAGVPRAS
jgi:hypothetical protein